MPATRRANDPLIAHNRRARYEYSIVESIEAGIELTGTEVKSLRTGRIQLRDGYVRIENGQAWLMQVNIASYQHGNRNNPEPERRRRLLLHKREIEYLDGRVRTQGLTIIPLRCIWCATGSRWRSGWRAARSCGTSGRTSPSAMPNAIWSVRSNTDARVRQTPAAMSHSESG